MDEMPEGSPQCSVARVDLIAAVGHELRGIVGAILHQVELLTGELDAALQYRSRKALFQSFDELNRFADALSDLERIERGELTVRSQSVNLAEVFSIDDRAPLSAADRERLQAVLDSVRSVLVDVDAVVLRRIINMLMSECHSRADETSVEIDRRAGQVEITLCAGGRESDVVMRPISIGDGIMPWVASVLAGAAGCGAMAANVGSQYTLSVPISTSAASGQAKG